MRQYHTVAALIAASVLAFVGVGDATACEGALAQVQIDAVEPGRTDVFAGKGRTVELRFTSETGQADPDVFPEPPLTVRNLASGAECAITKGGIWVRRSVWLTADERGIVLEEYSGSNTRLAIYDTATCKELTALDVSNGRWQVTGAQVIAGRNCTGDALLNCKEIQLSTISKTCVFERTQK